MAVGIDFYKLQKSVNSTAIPDANTVAAHYSGTFKEGSNVISPVVTLNATGGVTYFNYCYIPAYNRYYFVSNWTYGNGFWSAALYVDVLGTMRTLIGASSQYVERSASDFDTYVIDGLYPGIGKAPIQSVAVSAGYDLNGTFVVGVAGAPNGSTTGGGTTYFQFDYAGINDLMSMLFDSTHYQGLSGENLFYFNPYQYIVSVRYYPQRIVAGNHIPLNLGFYNLTSAPMAVDVGYTPIVNITLPEHPQVARGKYLNGSPYASYRLYIPCVGEIPISAEGLDPDNRTLTIEGKFDVITGIIVYTIRNDTTIIATATGIYGCDIAVSQVTITPNNYFELSKTNFISNIGHQIGDWLSGIKAPDLINGGTEDVGFSTHQAISGVVDSLSTSMLQASVSGSDGNRQMYYINPNYILYAQFVLVADDDPMHNGKPLMKRRTINTLSGYIKTANAHIVGDGSFTLPECQRAEILMNGGFYYE